MLITGAVMLVTWPDKLATHLCMRKNGGEAPGHDERDSLVRRFTSQNLRCTSQKVH